MDYMCLKTQVQKSWVPHLLGRLNVVWYVFYLWVLSINSFHVTLLSPRVLMFLLEFRKICGHLP